ncbi:hypothetical protein [Natronococcus sp.]|nr:hypothetical protein [Natronococcus sp.]
MVLALVGGLGAVLLLLALPVGVAGVSLELYQFHRLDRNEPPVRAE